MKKLFLLPVLMFTLLAYAEVEPSAFVIMKATSTNGTDATVRLFEHESFSADFDDEQDASAYLNDCATYPKVFNFYVPCAWGDASDAAEQSLEGIKMKFQSNQMADEVYTITFKNVSLTKELFLKDNMVKSVLDPTKDSLTAIVASGTYTFTQTKETTEQRFEIVSNAAPTNFYTREVAAGNWGTICYPDSLTLIEGATVYAFAAINTDKTQVAAQEVAVTAMTPGKPYLFLASAAEQKFTYFPESAVAAELPNVALVGNFTQDTLALTAEKWVINNQQVIPAAVGSKVPKYRAYVDLEDPNLPVNDNQFTPAPGRRIFTVKNTPTGMMMVEVPAMQNGKMMIDGKLVIIKDGKMFNAQGQEL